MVQHVFPRNDGAYPPFMEDDEPPARIVGPVQNDALKAYDTAIQMLANRCLVLETMLLNNWGEDEYKQHRDGAIEQLWPKPKAEDMSEIRAEVDARLNALAEATEERFVGLEELMRSSFERITTAIESTNQRVEAPVAPAAAPQAPPERVAPVDQQETPQAPPPPSEQPKPKSSGVSTDDVMTDEQWAAAQREAQGAKKGGKK